ncbi:hypothetical protein CAPTEDRAFT_135720, partial [Capitella teleta]
HSTAPSVTADCTISDSRLHHHFFKSNLRYTLVHTVNNLPPHIKSFCHTHSTDTFTKRAKAHIINQYSTICTIPNCYICHNR